MTATAVAPARWDPEDPEFWERTGKRVAARNLACSILTEHIGFSVWSVWSVLVLFLGPEYGFSPADKFLLVCTPTLVGAMLRIPYSAAVSRFGGRNWTVISALLLLVSTVPAAAVLHPGTSLGTLLVVAALGGAGGGSFASSMTNINLFYPRARKGWALGLNAGAGNLGAATVQLAGLLVLGTSGAAQPRLLLLVYLPLIVIGATCALLFMDNVPAPRFTPAIRTVLRDPRAWVVVVLYLGTFGSFVGYSFAFGLVLQTQFGRSPAQAAALGFLGPLIGSVVRPFGGWISDRIDGARVTAAVFLVLAAGTGVVIVASVTGSLSLFLAGFVTLFTFTGLGNGSTYKLIPAIASWGSGALIGVSGAVGALGGVLINAAFHQSFATSGTGVPAYVGFLVFYAVCCVLAWKTFLTRSLLKCHHGFSFRRRTKCRGPNVGDMTTSHEYVLSACCPDRAGVLPSVSGFLTHSSCDIVDCQLLSEPDSGTTFTRIHFAAPDAVDVGVLSEKFAELAIGLRMRWQVNRIGRRPRTMVLVSQEQHCLDDLLFRQRCGSLPVDVRAVVSNETGAMETVEWHGIQFHYLPIVDGSEDTQEARVLELARELGIEVVILAGYARMPSPTMCAEFPGEVINLRADRTGAKLIGATAHYVTADSAEGPVIEQDVRHVDHRDDPGERIAQARRLECDVLARAVKWHAEHRVLRNGNRTVVFP